MKQKNRKKLTRTLHAALVPAAMTALHTPVSAAPVAQIDEVIVTAQRREENLQQVPIAVVAFSQELLESSGIGGTGGLPQLVPSVQLVRSGPSAMFFVRGVGNTSGGTGEEGTNAFYVDGVFVADLKQTAMKFNNIERVEVLKGPQGTLFGRNSSGGLVNVITHEPGTQFQAKANLGLANYATRNAQIYLAGPVAETVSADIALTSTTQDEGWGKDRTTGKDVGLGWDWGIRTKWVWQPSDTTKIIGAGEYVKSSDNFAVAFRLAPESVGIFGTRPPSDPYDTNTSDRQFTDMDVYGATVTVEFDLDRAALTSITGMRENKTHSGFDSDTGPYRYLVGGNYLDLAQIELRDKTRSLQEELRLASQSDGALSWQTGVFLLRTEAELHPQTHRGFAFVANADPVSGGEHAVYSTLTTTSYAAFGEVSYAFASGTTLTAGLRYTRDELEFEGEQRALAGNARAPFSVEDATTANEPTYRLALRQDLTENFNIYASYNRGFKSGTYSMSSILVAPVEPQGIDAYEIGMKSQFFNNRLRLNVAAFHYDISDYQVRSATGISPTAVLLNAAEVDVDGVEIEFQAAPSENLRLAGAATWLDAEFADFDYAPFTYPRPAACTATGPAPGASSGAPSGGNITCIGSAKGNATPLAPQFAGNLSATYTWFAGAAGEVDLSLVYNYNDGYYFEADNRLEQPAFSTVNASILYRPVPQWAVELWGRNIADKTYYVQKIALSSLGDNAVPAAPRTYGVSLKYDF